jgi:hypothetical protein
MALRDIAAGTAIAQHSGMLRWRVLALIVYGAGVAGLAASHAGGTAPQSENGYRVELKSSRSASLRDRFNERQLALLEKLNRADLDHLEQLEEVVVPNSWSEDEPTYSPMPEQYAPAAGSPKFLVVYLPGQLFGAYEYGKLVRWGPVSSGGRSGPTVSGTFALNWRSAARRSTVDPDWFMRWYFNFGNREGLALHAYALPGHPASHGCIRLLERDAQWLFEWGDTWVLDPTETRVLKPGTPIVIFGAYDFDAPPPWRSLHWLSQPVQLPLAPLTQDDNSATTP